MPEAAQPSRFSITFYGLITLVPAGERQMLLALPDLRWGKGVQLRTATERGPLPEPIPPHVGCMVVPASYVVDQEEIGLEFRTRWAEARRLFAFDREVLQLGGVSEGLSVSLTDVGDAEGPEEGKPGGENDLAWVPPMGRTGISGADEFDARILAPNRAPSTDTGFARLVGTVQVEAGSLSSTGVVKAGSAPVIFEFSRMPAAGERDVVFRRAMFDKIVWEGTFSGDRLALQLTKGNGSQRSIDLKPVDGRVELEIHNQELEQIIGVGRPMLSAQPQADPDFAIGYWLSRAWDGLRPEDVVVPWSDAGIGIGGSGDPCRTGRFSVIA